MPRKKIHPLGDLWCKAEAPLFKMMEDHDLQHGEMLALFYQWLKTHFPGGQEEYCEGGHPVFFYGPEELLLKMANGIKKRNKKRNQS